MSKPRSDECPRFDRVPRDRRRLFQMQFEDDSEEQLESEEEGD